jgi:hypothetical protein
VYAPDGVIAPPLVPSATDQLAPVMAEPVTLAVNAWVAFA